VRIDTLTYHNVETQGARRRAWLREYSPQHLQRCAALIHSALEKRPASVSRGTVVLGAGACTEIPLEELTRHSDEVALADLDLNAVRQLLGPAIMYSANTIVFTAGALAFMLSISSKLTLYAFLPLPVVSIVVQYFGKRIHERFERIQAMFSDISARAQENFSGARVIRAYVQEDAEIAAFERSNQEYIARSLNLVRPMGMLWPTLELMLGCAVVLVLWLGGREVIHGLSHVTLVSNLAVSHPGVSLPAITTTMSLSGAMSVGLFVAFSTYMMQLTLRIVGKTLFDADILADAREVGQALPIALRQGQALFRRPRLLAWGLATSTLSWLAQMLGIYWTLLAYGIHENMRELTALTQYAHEQGLIDRTVAVEELFLIHISSCRRSTLG